MPRIFRSTNFFKLLLGLKHPYEVYIIPLETAAALFVIVGTKVAADEKFMMQNLKTRGKNEIKKKKKEFLEK